MVCIKWCLGKQRSTEGLTECYRMYILKYWRKATLVERQGYKLASYIVYVYWFNLCYCFIDPGLIMLKFHLIRLTGRASSIAPLKCCCVSPSLPHSSVMRRGDQSSFNESAQRCQTHRTCRHRDRNKLPLSDWIHLLHYGLNHITEMLNPKNVTGWRQKFKAVISYLFSQSNYPFDLNLNVRLRGFMVALNLLTDFAVV